MFSLQRLRQTRLLARGMLLWFVLAVTAAIASPIVNTPPMEQICSTGGAVRLVVKNSDGPVKLSLSPHSLDCPLCIPGGAPPPQALAVPAQSQKALSYWLQPASAAHIAWVTAAPLPARGPPYSPHYEFNS